MVRGSGNVLVRVHHVLFGGVEDSKNGWGLHVLASNGPKH